MNPPKSILSKDFRYVCAASTDVAKTFARVKRQLQAQQAKPASVVPIKRSK